MQKLTSRKFHGVSVQLAADEVSYREKADLVVCARLSTKKPYETLEHISILVIIDPLKRKLPVASTTEPFGESLLRS